METIIVTDLTRFNNNAIVCTAGIARDSGRCIRPMPYLQTARCKELNLLPGAILEGDLVPSSDVTGPHREDCTYTTLKFLEPCSSKEFRDVLDATAVPSVGNGFEIQLQHGQKVIPADHPVQRSIVTLSVDPAHLEIVESYGKLKVHFEDSSGQEFRFLPLTDLGFHQNAVKHHDADRLEEVNDLIHNQDEVFLRVGLSRAFSSPDGRNGYWLQVNGVYTFPHYHEGIRSYT